jgi:O-antigen ligase
MFTLARETTAGQYALWIGGIYCAYLMVFVSIKNQLNVPNVYVVLILLALYFIMHLPFIDNIAVSWKFINVFLTHILLALLVTNYVRLEGKESWFWATMLATSVVIAIVVFSKFGFDPIYFMAELKKNERASGLGYDANNFGFVCWAGIVALFNLEWKGPIKRLYFIGLLVFLFLDVLISASRGAFIMTVGFIMIVLFLKMHGIRRWLFVLGFVIAAYLGSGIQQSLMQDTTMGQRFEKVSLQDDSEGSRTNLYAESFEVFKEYMVFGVGFGMFKEHTIHKLFTHSHYMEMLVSGGLLGLPFLFMFYYLIIRRILAMPRGRIKNMAALVFLFLNVYGFFYPYLVDAMPMVLVGWIVGHAWKKEPAADPENVTELNPPSIR